MNYPVDPTVVRRSNLLRGFESRRPQQTSREGRFFNGRGGGIRTHGLFVPNEARYQTALRPDMLVAPDGPGGKRDP